MASGETIKILTLSGSLRKRSINKMLAKAIALRAPARVDVVHFDQLGDLPLFNPDLEGSEPHSVHSLRAAIDGHDGVIIASPEYAHGITGVMKNALDWLVGSGEFSGKPVALLNASPRSAIAYQSLHEIIRTIDACIVPAASLDIPVLGKNIDTEGIATHTELARLIDRVISEMVFAVEESNSPHDPRHVL